MQRLKAAPRAKPKELLQNHDKFELVRPLASGAFGVVSLARNKRTGQLVAIKFLERGSDKISKHVEREVVAHSNFCHPHVIQFKEVFLTRDHLAIVMEYAAGGDLFHFVKTNGGLREEDARWFFQQVIVGLDYCHAMGVVVRDIKLENTLLDASPRPLVKITDFGYCKSDQDSVPKSRVGTPGYTAPEVVSAVRGGSYDGKLADIWSAGVMLYIMLFCQYPFERPGDDADKDGFRKILERIARVDFTFPKYPRVSAACRDLVSAILRPPEQRLNLEGIQKHPWFVVNLPSSVRSMNDACLALKPHSHAGYQTVAEIQAIVRAAQRRHDQKPMEREFLDDMNDEEADDDMYFY